MRLYWVRHGEAENNKNNIWNENPSKQVNLTGEGKKHAEVLAEKLKDANIDAIFTSEFPRTKQTADIINKFHKVKSIESGLINERKAGYDGEDFFKMLPLLKKEILGEGGETIEKLKKRVEKFIEDLKTKKYKSLLIVTHMAIIQTVKGLINNLSNEEWRKLPVGYTEIVEQDI